MHPSPTFPIFTVITATVSAHNSFGIRVIVITSVRLDSAALMNKHDSVVMRVHSSLSAVNIQSYLSFLING